MISERVLVVGAGPVGAGIAQVVVAGGRRLLLHDPFPGAVQRALAGMRRSLANPRYAPCPLLRRYVAAGRFGRKSGRRFYEYA